MRFDKRNIQDHVNADRISPDIVLHDLSFFADKNNKGKQQDTGLALIILHATKPESKQNNQSSSSQPNKKYKTAFAQKFNYNRYLICGDALNPHHCFSIATTTISETNRLLKQAVNDSFLGMTFYLVEPPKFKKTSIGSSMTVLNCDDHQLLPLKWDPEILTRHTPIAMPPNAQETYYFVREKQELSFSKAHVPNNLSCSGFQCDRQKKQECLCLQTPFGSSLVYEFDIEFDVDRKQFKTDTYVATHRSLRTTSVFFKDFITFSASTNLDDEQDEQTNRRKQIQSIVEFINQHGGWKMIGWCKRGQISVDGESETIENDELNIHLSYVYPSDRAVLDNPQLKDLQIGPDNLNNATNAPAVGTTQVHQE